MRALAATHETLIRPVTVPAEALRYARNVALFVAAPFIGLAYALAFPFVGLGALAWLVVRALRDRRAAA